LAGMPVAEATAVATLWLHQWQHKLLHVRAEACASLVASPLLPGNAHVCCSVSAGTTTDDASGCYATTEDANSASCSLGALLSGHHLACLAYPATSVHRRRQLTNAATPVWFPFLPAAYPSTNVGGHRSATAAAPDYANCSIAPAATCWKDICALSSMAFSLRRRSILV